LQKAGKKAMQPDAVGGKRKNNGDKSEKSIRKTDDQSRKSRLTGTRSTRHGEIHFKSAVLLKVAYKEKRKNQSHQRTGKTPHGQLYKEQEPT